MYYSYGGFYKGRCEYVSNYFYILLLTSVCGAVCAVLAHGGYEKYIKYIASLICVLIMISPLRNIDISDILNVAEENISVPQIESQLYQNTLALTENSAESYISQIVFDKFGIKPSYVNIEIVWDKEEPVIQNITLALSGDGIKHKESINEYLFHVLGGEVEIIEE